MNVLLLLYLCADATRTDCQVLPAQSWQGPNAYEQCIGTVPGLTKALTAQNRQRHRFVCENPGSRWAKPSASGSTDAQSSIVSDVTGGSTHEQR